MASRGRGRGRSVSFNVEALGFSRGDALPAPTLQPPPIYPPQEFKPVPLLEGEDYEYMLALKQEFRGTIRKSSFYLQPPEKKKDIERYSDKYQLGNDSHNDWQADWSQLPSELKSKEKKNRKVKAVVQPNIPAKRSKKDEADIVKALEILEKKEDDTNKGDTEPAKESGEKGDAEEDEEELEEDYEDEDLEEETDYILNYFDNGEGYGDDDDDVDEGPIY